MTNMQAENIKLKFSSQGLIPAIIQDYKSGQVLMMAYMNYDSWQKTLETGYTWFWSRSRQKLWQKGESSGHTQKVKEIYVDCDEDTLLLKVEQKGAACHTGEKSCFYRKIQGDKEESTELPDSQLINRLSSIIQSRLKNKPANSYVASLAARGEDSVLRKLGEEATELMLALKNRSEKEIVGEAADLIFHTILCLEYAGVGLAPVLAELRQRHQKKTGERKQ